MNTIIITKEKKMGEEKIAEICSQKNIHTIDRTYLKRKEDVASIGIKDIKELLPKIQLKPLKSPEKAIIIEEADLLTVEAQNALLKTLEEPPINTIILLMSSSKEVFLPTILSRCQIITLKKNTSELGSEERKAIQEMYHTLTTLNTKQAFELAEKLAKEKEKTPIILEKLIIIGREIFLDEVGQKQVLNARIIKFLQITHTNLISSNINTRLELEHLFLSLTAD